MRRRLFAAIALLLALATVFGPGCAADAGRQPTPPQSVPADVTDVFATDLLPWVLDAADGGKDADAVARITGVGQVHEVFGFTPEFLDGDADAAVVRSLGHWSGVLVAGSDPVGVATVDRTSGRYAPATFAMSADMAAALARTDHGYFVEGSPRTGSWILADGVLTPVDSWALRLSTQPLALAAAQPLLARSADWVGSPVPALMLAGVGLLLAALVALAIRARPVQRPPHSPRAANT
ncbi:MAG: hypothetical protein U0Q21_08460 [Dermatophilaceae bacterium]